MPIKVALMANTFFDLVKLALPQDINPEDLLNMAPATWWQKNNYVASAYALRKYPCINWDAYLNNNPDVKAAGIDPCLHFLRHGIYEGRKLIATHDLRKAADQRPLVSVIINNYNNAIYLNHCIESVATQSLQNIEIIIVDDGSTDDSYQVITHWAKLDSRISHVQHNANLGTFMGRKNGIKAATGQYVMFVDSDDYLVPDACARAYEVIARGYDIVTFALALLPHGYVEPERVSQTVKRYLASREGKYDHYETIDAIFISRSIFWQIAGKIYAYDVLLKAVNDLDDAYLIYAEDVYLLLAISNYARSTFKINDQLYVYRYGSGITVEPDNKRLVKYILNMGESIRLIGEYAHARNMHINFKAICRDHCAQAIDDWLAKVPAAYAEDCFRRFTEQYGFKLMLKILLGCYSHRKVQVAKTIKACINQTYHALTKKHTFGIIIPTKASNIKKQILRYLFNLLQNNDKHIIVFTQAISEFIESLSDNVEIRLMPEAKGDYESDMRYLLQYNDIICEDKIDMILSADAYYHLNLWQILICHRFNASFAIIDMVSMYTDFYNIHNESAEIYFSIFRCAQFAICDNVISEWYLRSKGCNAIFLPAYEKVATYNINAMKNDNIISFLDCEQTYERIHEICRIMSNVVKVIHSIHLQVVCLFSEIDAWNMCEKVIEDAGLCDCITLSFINNDYNSHLHLASILLSVSFLHFDNEAVNYGLANDIPCVVYDAPGCINNDLPNIIKIACHDYANAANSIVQLLNNSSYFEETKAQAPNEFLAFSARLFADHLFTVITNNDNFAITNSYEHLNLDGTVKFAAAYLEF